VSSALPTYHSGHGSGTADVDQGVADLVWQSSMMTLGLGRTSADVGGTDLACIATDSDPSTVSGPAIDEGDWIRIWLWLRLGFGKV